MRRLEVEGDIGVEVSLELKKPEVMIGASKVKSDSTPSITTLEILLNASP